MNKEQRDVEEFHLSMNHGVESIPTVPSQEVIYLRARLVTEEFGEFIAALAGVDDEEKFRLVRFVQGFVRAYFHGRGPVRPNLVDLADAIADLKYVLEGTNLSFGIDGEPIWDAVHKANMTKKLGGVDEHGKQKKPPGWKPPDIAGLLREQGWKP